MNMLTRSLACLKHFKGDSDNNIRRYINLNSGTISFPVGSKDAGKDSQPLQSSTLLYTSMLSGSVQSIYTRTGEVTADVC